ncbi:MAG: hypothetical protein HYT75_04285 [Deltaproteobacteria bacterium]|nr:hypothetical protein [Deltaproteobacteria bacterium]
MSDLFKTLNKVLEGQAAWKIENEDMISNKVIDGVDGEGMHIRVDSMVLPENEYIPIEQISCDSFSRQIFDEFVYGKPQELCEFDPTYQSGFAAAKAVELSREVPKREMEREIQSIGGFGKLDSNLTWNQFNCYYGVCGWQLTPKEAKERYLRNVEISAFSTLLSVLSEKKQ